MIFSIDKYMNKINIFNIFKLALIFTVIDAVYLFSMSNNFQNMIKKIQGSKLKMRIIPTVFCYIFLISSLYYFVEMKNQKVIDAFFLGLFIYGVYETTNYAIIEKWNPFIALIDTVWGGLLFASTFFIYKKFVK
tara:strand:+ start:85 stop:486 length:402 start_codon:yes stop_codon:yes gene_type:complete